MNNQLTLDYLLKLKCFRMLAEKRTKRTSFNKINISNFKHRRLAPAGSCQFEKKVPEGMAERVEEKGG